MREIHSRNSSFILRRISQRQSLVTSVVVHAWLNQSRQGYFLCVFNDASEIPLNTHANVFGEIATSLTYSIDVVQTDWLTLGVSDGCNAIDVDGNNEIPSDNFLGNFLDDLF